MSCWLPAVAEAPSLRCTLEPLQAHGRNPGLLPGPSSSMGLERLLVRSVPWPPSQEWLFTLSCACPSLLALQCPLNNSGLAPIPGTLLWVSSGSSCTSGIMAGSWLLGRLLNVPSGGECWIWGPHPLCSRACRWTPWSGLQLLMSMVSLGRERSPCLAPGMLEGRRERGISFLKGVVFFLTPVLYS